MDTQDNTPTQTHDPAKYKALPEAELDGRRWTPYVLREYTLTRKQVNHNYPDITIRVTLGEKNPSVPDCYHPEAILADDLYFTPDWVYLHDLKEIQP